MTTTAPTTPPLAGDPCPLGHPTAAGQVFCPLCGTPLSQAPPPDAEEHSVVLGRFERLSPTRRSGAGASARRQYQRLRRAWLRELRTTFLAGSALMLVTLVALTAWTVTHRHPPIAWISLGVCLGVVCALLVAMRLSPPGYIANWQEGAWGEEWTAKELRPLARMGWTVLHDQKDRSDSKANFDHVVVGPSGVFLLDSKRWPGATTIEHGVSVLRRLEDPDLPALNYERVPSRQGAAAARLSAALKETGASAWVKPVVVIWGRFEARTAVDKGVTYVHGPQIRAWLEEQPGKLGPEKLGRVVAALTTALVPA